MKLREDEGQDGVVAPEASQVPQPASLDAARDLIKEMSASPEAVVQKVRETAGADASGENRDALYEKVVRT
eukprot:10192617-Alexandrium_andersonii.AAC.1